MLAIFISGAFLANAETAERMTEAVAKRIAGERGLILVGVAEKTIRKVVAIPKKLVNIAAS